MSGVSTIFLSVAHIGPSVAPNTNPIIIPFLQLIYAYIYTCDIMASNVSFDRKLMFQAI